MRIVRMIAVLSVALLVTGCACRSKKVGPGDENVPVPGEGSVLKDVNFAFDSYALDATSKSILTSNVIWLKANANAKVQIEGHCDERGTNEYNMALGSRRANAAMEFMRSLGIPADRMSTVSYGEELPLDPRHNEEAWAKNRRDHFNVQK